MLVQVIDDVAKFVFFYLDRLTHQIFPSNR